MNQGIRGIVQGILSGHSLIVRFIGKDTTAQGKPVPSYAVVNLEHLIAPKFGSNNGVHKDDPFAYDSWEFMRENSIGKRILVMGRFNIQANSTRQTQFGELPISYAQVRLYDTSEDLGELGVKAGMLKIRPNKYQDQQKVEIPYVTNLTKLEKEAKEKKIGIWSETPGFVRPLPVHFEDKDVLHKEFLAIIDSVRNATTYTVYLIPSHIHLTIQLAGCRGPYSKGQNDFGDNAKKETAHTLLHRLVHIRVSEIQEHANEKGKIYIGSFADKFDNFITKMLIEKGLATYFGYTADYAPNAEKYLAAEAEARQKGVGIWSLPENQIMPEPQPKESFDAICLSIIASNTICVIRQNSERKEYYRFNNLRIPFWKGNGMAEPLGFEIREKLRHLMAGKPVKITFDASIQERNYATIYYNNICINEYLARYGFGEIIENIVVNNSDKLERMKTAADEAAKQKIGIHESNLPEPLIVSDYTFSPESNSILLDELINKKVSGILERVDGGGRFIVLFPEQKIINQVHLNDILSYHKDDKFGKESHDYCVRRFQQTDLDVIVKSSSKSYGYLAQLISKRDGGEIDIANDLLQNGYAEIQPYILKQGHATVEQISLQDQARVQGVGVWRDKTRHTPELEYETVYTVKVVSVWDTLKLTVQFISPEIKSIEQIIENNLVPLEEPPKVNDCVVCKYNRQYYRARIDGSTEYLRDPLNFKCKLLDYGDAVEVPKSDLYQFAQELYSIEPQAKAVKLACLDNANNSYENIEFIWKSCKEVVLYMHLVYNDEIQCVLLTDKQSIENSGSLNALLLNKQIAKVSDHEVPPMFTSVLNNLKAVQEQVETLAAIDAEAATETPAE